MVKKPPNFRPGLEINPLNMRFKNSLIKIRYLHPLLFAGFYKLLAFASLTQGALVAYGPRLFQGFAAAATDFCVWKVAGLFYGDFESRGDARQARFALLLSVGSWFHFFVLPRTFSNAW